MSNHCSQSSDFFHKCSVFSLAFLLLFQGPSSVIAENRPSNNDPSRFLGVERWTGSIDVEMVETETFILDCGSDLWKGKVKPYGKKPHTTRMRASMHLNVDIPSNDAPGSEDEKKEEQEEAKIEKQMKQLESMAAQIQAVTGESMSLSDTDEAEEQMRSYGDVNFKGPHGRLGTGQINWSHDESWTCPNHVVRGTGRGSGPVTDASILMTVNVGKDREYYSLSVTGWDQIKGTLVQNEKTLSYDEYCVPGNGGMCVDWRRVFYWDRSKHSYFPSGKATYYYKSGSKKHPQPASTSTSQTVPPMGLGIGSNAAGMPVVNITDGKLPFDPPVYEPGPGQITEETLESYRKEMNEFIRKAFPQLPRSGNTLQGSTVWVEEKNEPEHQFKRTSTLRWNLAPQGSAEYEVEVTIKDYDSWRPRGHKDPKKRGSTLGVSARLIDAKTKKPSKTKAEKFIFALERTSKVPGTAMNWPVDGNSDEDLKFEASENPADRFTILDNGQKIETKGDRLLDGASVKISSFDWGAYGELHVKAVLPGGSSADGQLKDSKDRTILLPKRQVNSHIADAWKKKTRTEGKTDEADDEKKPENRMEECASHQGDGLSLYEEYRGFYSKRDPAADQGHIEGDPEKKDYFVVDTTGVSAAAIYHFASVTGLHTHAWLTLHEMRDDYSINFNKGPDNKNPVKQHAVELMRGHLHEFVSETISDYGMAQPGPPGLNHKILIGYGLDAADLMNTVPHELLHASNVWHHGDRDKQGTTWEYAVVDGQEVILEKKNGFQDKVIQAIFEKTKTPISPQKVKEYQYKQGGQPVEMYIAKRHGQHSGDVNCLMRYDLADAYDPVFPHSSKRVFIDEPAEPVGMGLCTTSQGTGINAAPLKRHGACDLVTDRGKCRYQICVNDKYMLKHKPRHAKG